MIQPRAEKHDLFADIARAFDALVGYGYRAPDIWAMTPRAMGAALELAQARYRRELADDLSISAIAARGEGSAIDDHIKALTK